MTGLNSDWLILGMCILELSLPRVLKRIETFRFKEEDDYEYDIWLWVFSRILKIETPRKASFYHFSREKLALLPLVEEVLPSLDRKMTETTYTHLW